MTTYYGIDNATGLRDAVVKFGQDHLGSRGGIAARDMPTTRVRRGHQIRSDYADAAGGITVHSLWLTHPELGGYGATVTVQGGQLAAASYAYDGEQCEVNGIVYGTRRRAKAVRAALEAAGIGHYYPGCPEAKAVLARLDSA